MKSTTFVTTVLLAATASTAASAQARRPTASPDAKALVQSAIVAMQGSGNINDVHSLRLQGFQHEYMLGNAERSDGPFQAFYSSFAEYRDLDHDALRRTEQQLSGIGKPGPERVTILTDTVLASVVAGREAASGIGFYEDMIDRVQNTPDRALKLASSSPSLTWKGTAARYGLTFDVVSFPWRNGRMQIEISRADHFPVAVEIVRPYPDNFRWGPFGDVHMRTEYLGWDVMPNGIWWPREQRVTMNGEPLREISLGTIAFDAAMAAADSFAVADSTRANFTKNTPKAFSHFAYGSRGPAKELRPGILRVPDQWSMTVVKQDDGLVIFESHLNAKYFDDLVADMQKRYPGSRIKAVVLTSDPWGHIGGVRQVIARGIPIYVTAASVPFFKKLAAAPHTMLPDSLQRAPRAAQFIPVSEKTTIGTGTNRIELYPVRGEYGERMLMAYFPEHRLLYGADLVFMNRGPDGKVSAGFVANAATDLRNAVQREHLSPLTLFCVQNYGPFDYPAFANNELKQGN